MSRFAGLRPLGFLNRPHAACAAVLILWGAGWGTSSPPAAHTPVTQVDPILATPDYWLDKPAVVQVEAADFYQLWNICRSVAHDRFFQIDREDYREGLLTTQPLVSKQWWELWRRDVVTVHGIEESTLATIRRTIRFQLTEEPGGRFRVEPKVLVERFASAERRLTAITEYHAAFSGPRPFGSAETDQGLAYPLDYWYAIGRDNDLEKDLAAAIERRLHG